MSSKNSRRLKVVFATALLAVAGPSAPTSSSEVGVPMICPVMRASTPQNENTLRVFSANVQDLPHAIADQQRRHGPYPANRFDCLGGIITTHDVALLQEDFTHQTALRHSALPHVWNPRPADTPLRKNSGVSMLSRYPISHMTDQPFDTCHGNVAHAVPFHIGKMFGAKFKSLDSKGDCFASKAFKVAQIRGITFINTHMDAGRLQGDIAARRAQFEELNRATPRTGPLVVAMDANVREIIAGDREALARYMRNHNLTISLREETDVVLTREVEVTGRRVIPLEGMSDHNGLSVTVRVTAPVRGR